ncbi:MAG: hypothetical protein R3286_19630 [Gammaproteobacteria bacterium]|nr:hypothetical protein [Gammaproteobacteria bacterium]
MEELYSFFPARREWPPALDDVANVAPDAESARLKAGARNIGALPARTELKSLWCFNVDQAYLDTISRCASLESLHIENVKAEDLACLSALKRLKVLSIESCFKVTSLEALRDLRTLSGLAVIHFKNVHELGPLSSLSDLRALAVAGSMWTAMRVESLRPLAGLRDLRLLHLSNLKTEDESLRPLGGLRNLVHLDIANFYPMSEFAFLSQRLIGAECTWFEPYVTLPHMPCKKCGQRTMVMLTGKRKPTLCSRCNSKRLEKHVLEWNELAGSTA